MSDIPAYGARDPLPWNPDSGKPVGPTGSETIAWDTDLILDPMREPSSNDPASGWDGVGQRINED